MIKTAKKLKPLKQQKKLKGLQQTLKKRKPRNKYNYLDFTTNYKMGNSDILFKLFVLVAELERAEEDGINKDDIDTFLDYLKERLLTYETIFKTRAAATRFLNYIVVVMENTKKLL